MTAPAEPGPRRFVRFAAVGASGVLVNLGALHLLVGLDVGARAGALLGINAARISDVLGPYGVASAAAIEVSILWNYALNNAYTFRDRVAGADAGAGVRFLRYHAVSAVGGLVQYGTARTLLAAVLAAVPDAEARVWLYPAQFVGIILATGWNFAANHFYTWAQSDVAHRPAGGSA